MDVRFRVWNVRSLYRMGSLMTVSSGLAKYKLDLVGVQEVRWEDRGTEPAGKYMFFYKKGNENHELGTGFLCTRESYQQLRGSSLLLIGYHITLRGHWCHIIVLNVHAPTEDKSEDVEEASTRNCNVCLVNPLNTI
jgi:exonuclease III